jgi:hypothetical protein
MPAKDIYHDAVKRALQKEGWTITHDPLFVRVGGIDVSIDLGAELIAAEKEGQKIAVEVKSFVGPSTVNEFHTALGQFLNYREALEVREPERILFLAVPADIYDIFFMLPLIQSVTKRYQLMLILYDHNKEVIVKWQK